MGLDLTDPKELDWLARGRKGENPSFDESFPSEKRQEEVYKRLLNSIGSELERRAGADVNRSEEDLKKAARGILSPLSSDEIHRISKKTWEEVNQIQCDPENFGEIYWQNLADKLIDYWDSQYRGENRKGNSGRIIKPK